MILVHELIYLYVHGTYNFMNVNICMDVVQTRLQSFTTTLHFPSAQGPISLVTSASLSSKSAQAQRLQSSHLPVISLLIWQTTQALLAMSKLPQPLVYLRQIAATQAIPYCSVNGVPVRNGRGLSHQPGTKGPGSWKLCPPHWDKLLKHVCT